jgi:hypothetical protein
MKHRSIRAIAAATILSLGASSLGCGYLLHPERRGNRGGSIDGGSMVMDLLWLLPGIVPGVVALIVDFSSGAIYVNGRTSLRLAPKSNVALRLPESATPAVLEVRLVTSARRVLAHETVSIGPNVHDRWVELDPGDAARTTHEQIFLEVLDANGAPARLSTPIAVHPT